MIWTNNAGETVAVPNIRHISNIQATSNGYEFTIVSDSDNNDNSGLKSSYPTLKEAEYQVNTIKDIIEGFYGFAGTFDINDYILVIPFIKQISNINSSIGLSQFIIYFIGRTILKITGEDDSIARRHAQLLNCIDDYWNRKRKSSKTLTLV